MTKQEVVSFRNDFEKLVIQLEKDYGVNIQLGTIRYSNEGLRAKIMAVKGDKVEKLNKNDFKVGDIVNINHKKVNPNDTFEVIKINQKNIKVKGKDGIFSVSPGLLIKNK